MHHSVRALSLVGSVLGFSVLAATAVQAQDVSRAFEVTIEEGGLTGEVFSGNVTFDASFLGEAVILFPDEFSLEFDFLGETFTEEDDFDFPFFPTAELNAISQVIGLSYLVDTIFLTDASIDAFFGFIPGDDGVGDEFIYTLFDGGVAVDSGAGTLVPVPEPASTVALGLLGLGALVGRKALKAA